MECFLPQTTEYFLSPLPGVQITVLHRIGPLKPGGGIETTIPEPGRGVQAQEERRVIK